MAGCVVAHLVWQGLVFQGMGLHTRQIQAGEPATEKETAEQAANVLGLPQGAMSGGGTLMVCGGGALPEEVYDEFVRLAGGPKCKLVLIPSAHPYENLEAITYRFNGWLQYPAESFHFLHATSRAEAESDDFAKPLEDATGVWITGGAQGRLADLYKGTARRKTPAAIARARRRRWRHFRGCGDHVANDDPSGNQSRGRARRGLQSAHCRRRRSALYRTRSPHAAARRPARTPRRSASASMSKPPSSSAPTRCACWDRTGRPSLSRRPTARCPSTCSIAAKKRNWSAAMMKRTHRSSCC